MPFQLKLSRILEKISRDLRQKALFLELDWYMKNRESYTHIVFDYDRGIGKTITLLQLAHKYKCPIAVETPIEGSLLKHYSRVRFKKPIEVIVCSNKTSLIGKRFNRVLCEDSLSDESHAVLSRISKVIVGFKNGAIYRK